MRLRPILPIGLLALLPAAALAAGLRLGPPLETPPTPNVPLGPIEIGAPPDLTPPVAAPPIDLQLPERGRRTAAARAVSLSLSVPASSFESGEGRATGRALRTFTIDDLFVILHLRSAPVAPPDTVVPEPTTGLLVLLGLSGLALRRR